MPYEGEKKKFKDQIMSESDTLLLYMCMSKLFLFPYREEQLAVCLKSIPSYFFLSHFISFPSPEYVKDLLIKKTHLDIIYIYSMNI